MEAYEFLSLCMDNGVEIEIRGCVLTLSKRFNVVDKNGYVGAETDCGLIYEAPQTQPGSTWGTSSDGVGCLSAMKDGRMVLNRSGVSLRWLKTLKKLIDLRDMSTKG